MTLKTCKLFIHLMKFSTLHPQLPHIETRDPANVLVVGQTIVEEQGYPGGAGEGTPGTLEWFIVRQVLVDSLPHVEQRVFQEVHLVVESFVTKLTSFPAIVGRPELGLEFLERNVELGSQVGHHCLVAGAVVDPEGPQVCASVG